MYFESSRVKQLRLKKQRLLGAKYSCMMICSHAKDICHDENMTSYQSFNFQCVLQCILWSYKMLV